MNIKPVEKTTLRGKQTVSRVTIDGILIRANRTAVDLRGKSRIRLAKNFDANVHGNGADASGSLGVRE